MPEVPNGSTGPGSLAEEALRRGKRFRRRRRVVARGIAGVAVAGVSAGVALGIVVQPAQPARFHSHPVQAVTTTSSLALHGPRSHPPVTHHPAKQPHKPPAQSKTMPKTS